LDTGEQTLAGASRDIDHRPSAEKAITKIPCKPIEVWIGHRFGNAEYRKFSANRQAAAWLNYACHAQ